jgi:deazaflavin-dependent oxidoreductase (nitroreductase family)
MLKLVKRQYRRNFGRRLINTIVSGSVRLGVGPACRYELTVPGRRSRLPHTTPVSVVTDGAMRYLVGPYGETGWVRNARAAGSVTLTRAGKSERFALQGLTPSEAGPILRRYLKLEPVTRPYFDVKPDAADEAFVAEAASHPVFRLMPIGN